MTNYLMAGMIALSFSPVFGGIIEGNKGEYITLESEQVQSTPGKPKYIGISLFETSLNSDNVTLQWTTEEEVNIDYFELQHSADGTSFQSISKVKSDGPSTEKRDYTYTDKSPLKGKNYYRLLVVSLEKVTYQSDIILQPFH